MYRARRVGKVFFIATGCIALSMAMGGCSGDVSNPYGEPHPLEQSFVQKVQEFQAMADAAENDLQIAEIQRKSRKAICVSVPAKGTVTDWRGKLVEIDANADGKAVVEIEIASEVRMATWNNAISDVNDGTLIGDGPLRDKLLTLKEGQIVSFTGQILPEGKTCFRNMALLKVSQLTRPRFLFKFKSISPI